MASSVAVPYSHRCHGCCISPWVGPLPSQLQAQDRSLVPALPNLDMPKVTLDQVRLLHLSSYTIYLLSYLQDFSIVLFNAIMTDSEGSTSMKFSLESL